MRQQDIKNKNIKENEPFILLRKQGSLEEEKRYVHVESKFQEGRLLLSIKNSKPSGTSSCQQTSKKDKIKHGRGIRSVRKVAEKYGGELMLKDQGEHFEAVLLLNGVAKLE